MRWETNYIRIRIRSVSAGVHTYTHTHPYIYTNKDVHKRCTVADKASGEAVKLVATIFGRLHSFRGSKLIFAIYRKIITKTKTKNKYNKATDA